MNGPATVIPTSMSSCQSPTVLRPNGGLTAVAPTAVLPLVQAGTLTAVEQTIHQVLGVRTEVVVSRYGLKFTVPATAFAEALDAIEGCQPGEWRRVVHVACPTVRVPICQVKVSPEVHEVYEVLGVRVANIAVPGPHSQVFTVLTEAYAEATELWRGVDPATPLKLPENVPVRDVPLALRFPECYRDGGITEIRAAVAKLFGRRYIEVWNGAHEKFLILKDAPSGMQEILRVAGFFE